MINRIKRRELITAMIVSTLVCILMLFAFFWSISSVVNQKEQEERLQVLERFLSFELKSEAIINEGIYLLEGYRAYLEANPEISYEDTDRYLNNLLGNKETLVRNIGIVKNTTIIWNYPPEENSKAIGVDLAAVPSQRDDLLKVKDTLKPMFLGPIDLVQGGIGFIARMPVEVGGEYWGQISIVLDAETYLSKIQKIASNLDLNIALYNDEEFPREPFYGDAKIIDRDGIVLNINHLNNNWKFAVEPQNGWSRDVGTIYIFQTTGLLISFIIAFLLFGYLVTRSELKNQAMNDYLTGLYNRNYLEIAYNDHLQKIEQDNGLLGLYLLDMNGLKQINDNYGHKIGDLVITELAERLRSLGLRKKSVFRLGGDEFFILVSGYHNLSELEEVEELINQSANFKYFHENLEIDISSSVGLAICPTEGTNLDELMHIADSRMYLNKRRMKQRP